MEQERTQTAANVFGVRLRKLRTAHRWSQADVADLLAERGVVMSQQTVAKIERGARPTSVDDLLALAQIFNMTIGELVGPVDDAFGLGPSPVVQQLGDVEQQIQAESAKADALQGEISDMKETVASVVDMVEDMRRAFNEGSAPAFMESFNQLVATKKAVRLVHPDVEELEEDQ